jgi:hypothetical protein
MEIVANIFNAESAEIAEPILRTTPLLLLWFLPAAVVH